MKSVMRILVVLWMLSAVIGCAEDKLLTSANPALRVNILRLSFYADLMPPPGEYLRSVCDLELEISNLTSNDISSIAIQHADVYLDDHPRKYIGRMYFTNGWTGQFLAQSTDTIYLHKSASTPFNLPVLCGKPLLFDIYIMRGDIPIYIIRSNRIPCGCVS